MDFPEKALYHQIHPAKLAADILSGLAALALLWYHQVGAAIAIAVFIPVGVSMGVMCLADLEKLKASWAGKRMGRMTGALQAARLLLFIVSAAGAYYNDVLWTAFGLLAIAACWYYVMKGKDEDKE